MKVWDIKSMFSNVAIEKRGCLEKMDLIAVLACFEKYRQHMLSELHSLYEEHGGCPYDSVEQCAEILANPVAQNPAAPSPKTPTTPRPYQWLSRGAAHFATAEGSFPI
jgi:hypothetical protein